MPQGIKWPRQIAAGYLDHAQPGPIDYKSKEWQTVIKDCMTLAGEESEGPITKRFLYWVEFYIKRTLTGYEIPTE